MFGTFEIIFKQDIGLQQNQFIFEKELKLDLGIKGKRAIVCASSKGLGLGCALSLAEAGVDLIINSRNAQNLESAAYLLKSKYQVNVETVVADITTKEGQEAVIKKAKNNLDILVTNAGGPPPGL